jgi:HEAT repeat protein
LGELRAERSVDELAAAFNADPEARVRGAAGAALRSIGTPRALRALDAR